MVNVIAVNDRAEWAWPAWDTNCIVPARKLLGEKFNFKLFFAQMFVLFFFLFFRLLCDFVASRDTQFRFQFLRFFFTFFSGGSAKSFP